MSPSCRLVWIQATRRSLTERPCTPAVLPATMRLTSPQENRPSIMELPIKGQEFATSSPDASRNEADEHEPHESSDPFAHGSHYPIPGISGEITTGGTKKL